MALRRPEASSLLYYSGGFAPVGGVETLALELLPEVVRAGVSTTMVMWGREGEITTALRAEGIAIRRSPWRWGCRWQIPDALLWGSLGRRALRDDVPVLFGKTFGLGIHRRIARQGTGRRVLVTPYRPSEFWHEERRSGSLPELLSTFDCIMVQARSFEKDLRRDGYEGDVRVQPYPPPLPRRVRPPPGNESVHVGFLGRLALQKNVPFLLEAFASLDASCRRDGLRAHFHIFGDGPERYAVERAVQQLGLAGKVTLHGEVARDEVDEAISSCHLFTFGSHSEGQCMAALEILSRGRPIVSTAVGALPEVVSPELGIVGPGRDAHAFAEMLRSAYRKVLSGEYSDERVRRNYSGSFRREEVVRAYLEALGLREGRAGDP